MSHIKALEDEHNLRRELAALLNKYSRENRSDTPDFILADFLADCLDAFDSAQAKRTKWRGKQ